ncbi:MAG: FimV/HubP family polar landmark protein [Gammaproteobacteria bacterium]
MPRKSVSLLLTAMFSTPLSAFGLGLGDISLDSSLNEPLKAIISIDAVQPGDLTNFKATVATGETFSRYGLDRPDFLNSLRFEITVDRGRPELMVRSTEPITEPFVTFLVEANWDSGRLLREYTVLLDPPVFNPQSVAPPVRAPRTAGSQLSSSSGFVPRPEPAPQPAPIRRPAVAPITGPSYGPVRRNETLWAIADRARSGTGLSVNQMMIAIYNANPEAFLGNINLLKEGSTLALPDASQAAQIGRQDAFVQARDHNQRWRAGGTVARTPSPVVASTPSAEDERRLRLVAPDGGSSDAGLSDIQEQLEEEQTRNTELNDEIEQLRGELADNERLFNMRNAELSELQARLGEPVTGDGAVDVSQTEFETVDTETPSATVDGTDPAQTDAEDPATVASIEPQVGSETAPPVTTIEDPAPAPVVKTPAPIQSAPSLIDRVVGVLSSIWPFLLGGLALLGGLLFWRSRRESDTAEAESWEALSRDSVIPTTETPIPASGQIEVTEGEASDADVEYFEDTGTFKPIDFREAESDAGLESAAEEADAPAPSVDFPFEDTLAGDDALKLDQSDPLAEADFHIAYGLYDQAADLVRAASQREPERRDLKLKLLEIFFVWGNKESFVESAQALRNDMGDAADRDWDKVAIMGRQICPDDALFAGDGTVSADVVDLQLDETGETPIDLSTETMATDVEMDFNLDDAIDAAGDNAAADNVIDFDFSGTATTAVDEEGDTIREKIEAATEASEDTEEIELAELGIDLDFSSSDVIDEPMTNSQTLDTGATGQVEALDIEVGEDFDELFGGLDEEMTTLEPDTSEDVNASTNVSETMADFAAAQEQERDKLLDTSELKVEMEELLASAVTMDDDAGADEAPLLPASEVTGSFSAEIASLADDGADVDLDFALDVDDDDATELIESIDIDATQQGEVAADFSADVFGSDEDTVLATALKDVDKLGADSMTDNDFGEIFADDGEGTAVIKMEDQDFSGDEEATVLAQVPVDLELPIKDNALDDLSFEGLPDDSDSDDEAFADAVFGSTDEAPAASADDATQESVSIDLDVGDPLFDDSTAMSENTTMKVAAQELALPDMDAGGPSEVGTKLDLARAYMEMGDPDGARGILQEVIEEGDDGQKQDARALLDALP